MADKKYDGGPAFAGASGSDGMSLRDWFAGQALCGMIAGSQGLAITREEFARDSYKIADEMLKAAALRRQGGGR